MSVSIAKLTDGQLQELMRIAPDAAMEEGRRRCLKRERDRERNWRGTGQGAFVSSMSSLDECIAKSSDPSKMPMLSDGGSGAAAVRNGADVQADALEDALGRLSDSDRKFAQAVLDGKTWRELGMPKRTFNWKIKKVCSLIAHPPSKTSL